MATQVSGNPAGRVLTLLERVQERPGLTGPRLAAELGVTERTIRRYVVTLQNLGIPVEPSRGRVGGYRLRAGFRMPPLMLSTAEAVAVTLSLAVMNHRDDDAGADPTPVESALAKLLRVLPREVAGRVDDVLSAVTRPRGGWSVSGPAPDPGVLTALAAGVVGRRRCRLRHRAQHGDVTVREVNPYGVAVVQGARGWYLHAWCHLRQARRTFRIDRIEGVDVLSTTFAAPAGLDIAAAVERSLALARPEWVVTMLFHGPIAEVEQCIPRHFGVCEAVDETTTRVRSSSTNLDYFALRISDHPFPMTVVEPDELRGAFERHAQRMLTTARGKGRDH